MAKSRQKKPVVDERAYYEPAPPVEAEVLAGCHPLTKDWWKTLSEDKQRYYSTQIAPLDYYCPSFATTFGQQPWIMYLEWSKTGRDLHSRFTFQSSDGHTYTGKVKSAPSYFGLTFEFAHVLELYDSADNLITLQGGQPLPILVAKWWPGAAPDTIDLAKVGKSMVVAPGLQAEICHPEGITPAVYVLPVVGRYVVVDAETGEVFFGLAWQKKYKVVPLARLCTRLGG
ncbi:hypothetical protein EIP91_008598 [Steccherinum ochraceum]|uniref:Uncharacterized protein n=1 Tax=Steccherinum ochraceum TaxID=92696 RepID=A0A4R0RPM3_9APHY|nr:hypothetical protein EIP91_008598 [Steccherinum ochraceum]